MHTYQTREIIVFRMASGAELISELTTYCQMHEIEMAQVLGIGALRDPEIGSYDFEADAYESFTLAGDWEMLTFNANVSLKDDAPFVHPHVLLGNAAGEVRGGHLFAAEVLVAELQIHVLDGTPLHRVPDPVTGLMLWPVMG